MTMFDALYQIQTTVVKYLPPEYVISGGISQSYAEFTICGGDKVYLVRLVVDTLVRVDIFRGLNPLESVLIAPPYDGPEVEDVALEVANRIRKSIFREYRKKEKTI